MQKGGTQRVAQTFAEAYYELGNESKILSLYGLGSRFDEISDHITIFDGLTNVNLNEIKIWHPDVIHIHSHGPKLNDILLLLQTVQSCSVIETNVFSKPSPWANKVDISFQLSHWACWLFNLRGGSVYNSQIIPNPIKCRAFKKANIDEIIEFRTDYKIPLDAFLIGRIGQSYPGKWSHLLVKTFNELAIDYTDIYLLVVNAPNFVLEQIKISPFKERIISIDQIIGDKALSIVYSSMNVMALTAEQGESFGVVSTESILCETPVVALATPWGDNSQCEVIGHLKGGFVVNSEKGLKTAIQKIYTKLDGLAVGTIGVNHIYENFDYLKIAQNAIDAIKLNIKPTLIDNDSILMNSLDRPSLMTRLFIKMNSNKLRILTMYTSGYKKWKHLYVLVYKKFFN